MPRKSFRHLDELDALGHVQRAENRTDEFEPGVRVPGADVEESVGVGFGQVQRHVGGIFDVEEVALLLAVPVTRAGSS